MRINATSAPDHIVAGSQKDNIPTPGQASSLKQPSAVGLEQPSAVGQPPGLGHAMDVDVGSVGNVPKTSSPLESLLYEHPLPVTSLIPLASSVPEHQKNSLVW